MVADNYTTDLKQITQQQVEKPTKDKTRYKVSLGHTFPKKGFKCFHAYIILGRKLRLCQNFPPLSHPNIFFKVYVLFDS